MGRGRLGAATALGLLLAASAAAADIRTAPLEPEPAGFRADVPARLARIATAAAALAPPAFRPGPVEIIDAAAAAALRKSFIGTVRAAGSWSGRAIRVGGGVWPLDRLAGTVADPALLACDRGGCELKAPILIEAGATLHIGAAAGSAELRFSQPHGAFIASHGLLLVLHASLSGRDADGRPAGTDGPAFRPFLLVYDTGRLVVASSRLAHMGYDAPSAYGVTLTTTERAGEPSARPSALLHDSVFRDLYYGFYSHGAEAVDIAGNRYIDNIHYGIDPHDDSRDLAIVGNVVQGTRIAHGIIASRRVSGIVVDGNRSIGNAGAGIALDRGVTGALITDNLVTGNGSNGITVYESHDSTIAGNRIVGNGRSGIRLRQAAGIRIVGNLIVGNGRHGLEASNRTPEREATPEEAGFARPVALTLAGNRFADNALSACTLKGIFRLDLLPPPAGGPLAPCGEAASLGGDKSWIEALTAASQRREPLRLELR